MLNISGYLEASHQTPSGFLLSVMYSVLTDLASVVMGSKGVIVIVHQTSVLMEVAVLWRLQKVKRDRDGYAAVWPLQ